MSKLSQLNKKQTKILWWVFSAAAVLFLLLLRSNHYSTDSLDYAWNIRESRHLFHEHHILYNPIVWLIHRTLNLLWINIDTILAAQIYSSILAVLSSILIYRIGRDLLSSKRTSWLLAAACFFSFGVWRYATQVEVYLGSLFFILCMIKLLTKRKQDEVEWKSILLISASWVLAVGHHQTNVLLAIPLFAFAFYQGGMKLTFRLSAAVSIIAGLTTLAIYFIGMKVEGESNLLAFATDRFQTQGDQIGSFDNFSFSGLNELVIAQNGAFLTNYFSNKTLFVVPFYLFLAAVLFLNIRILARGKEKKNNPIRLFLLTTIGIYYLTFLWIYPAEVEFYIALVGPLLLLSALAAPAVPHSLRGRLSKALILAPVLLAGLNGWVIVKHHFVLPDAKIQAHDIRIANTENCILCDEPLRLDYYRYFERTYTINVGHLARYYRFPGFDHLPKDEFPREDCRLVSTNYIYRTGKYDDFNFKTRPKEWKDFLLDLFDVQQIENKLRGREYSTKTIGGEVFLVIGKSLRTYSSEAKFFDELQKTLDDNLDKTEGNLGQWYRQNFR